MSRRDDSVPMRHMLDYARETVALVRDRNRRDIDNDRMLQLALDELPLVIAALERALPGHVS